MWFASTPSALHPEVLVSFPVMAVVSGLTLQWDSSLQHYRPDRTTHCDLQLLLLQGHLDHNHSWTLSSRLSSLSPLLSLLHPPAHPHCTSFRFAVYVSSTFVWMHHWPFLPHTTSPFCSSFSSPLSLCHTVTCTLTHYPFPVTADVWLIIYLYCYSHWSLAKSL